MKRDYHLEKRKYVLGGSVVLVVLIYLIRLFTIQIMSEDYKKSADSNAFLNKTQYPSRGVMYDRTGKLLVYNQPAYDVTMVMREVTDLDTLDFCQTLGITPEYFKRRIREMKDKKSNPGYSPYTHQVFMTQLSAEECGVFQEKLFKFPGFYIQRRTIRQYNYNSAAHVLGDIAEVSKKDIAADDYYVRGDFIGKQGIEAILKSKSISNNYDILKVPHHGSKYSCSIGFLNSVNAEIAIISCGYRNSYGHPHEDMIEGLKDLDCDVYRTDYMGAIIVNTSEP